MRRVIFSACVLGAVTVAPVRAAAPSLAASLDTARVHLGDPLRLHLRVERDADARTLFPELDDAVAPLRLRGATAPTSTRADGNGRQRDERVYELAAYQLDVEQVPSVEVAVVSAAGDTVRLRSAALDVDVVPVRQPDEDDELRAIKPPFHIPGGVPLWLVAVGAALLALGLAFLVRALWLRRRPQEAVPASVPRAPVDYEREFARIAAMGLLERGGLKPYYTRLADVMRSFLEDVVGLDARERTTAEIEADLQRRVAELAEAPTAPVTAAVRDAEAGGGAVGPTASTPVAAKAMPAATPPTPGANHTQPDEAPTAGQGSAPPAGAGAETDPTQPDEVPAADTRGLTSTASEPTAAPATSAAAPASGPSPAATSAASGRRSRVDAEIAARIVAFLEAADLVKFARATPPESEARGAPDEGRAIVAAVVRARPAAAPTATAATPG